MLVKGTRVADAPTMRMCCLALGKEFLVNIGKAPSPERRHHEEASVRTKYDAESTKMTAAMRTRYPMSNNHSPTMVAALPNSNEESRNRLLRFLPPE